MSKTPKQVVQELQRIAAKHDGILKAEDVVTEAKRKSSPIHDQFTWDDSEAGHQYRLWQARQLIRCSVIMEQRTETQVRAFVSLSPNRTEDGGGYKETVRVLSRKEDRAQLLADALAELKVFETKYRMLTELTGVFEEARRVRIA